MQTSVDFVRKNRVSKLFENNLELGLEADGDGSTIDASSKRIGPWDRHNKLF